MKECRSRWEEELSVEMQALTRARMMSGFRAPHPACVTVDRFAVAPCVSVLSCCMLARVLLSKSSDLLYFGRDFAAYFAAQCRAPRALRPFVGCVRANTELQPTVYGYSYTVPCTVHTLCWYLVANVLY